MIIQKHLGLTSTRDKNVLYHFNLLGLSNKFRVYLKFLNNLFIFKTTKFKRKVEYLLKIMVNNLIEL